MMTLQEQLNVNGQAIFEREKTDEMVNVFAKKQGTGYWLVTVKGSKKTNVDCATFDEVVSHLNAGEAESSEWFDL